MAEAVGGTVATLGDAIDAATSSAHVARRPYLSVSAPTALLVTAWRIIHGTAPVDRVVSTVGAGMSCSRAYLSATAETDEAFGNALAWAAAAVQHHGTLFSPDSNPAPVTISESISMSQKLT